jgi:hypothetical protein
VQVGERTRGGGGHGQSLAGNPEKAERGWPPGSPRSPHSNSPPSPGEASRTDLTNQRKNQLRPATRSSPCRAAHRFPTAPRATSKQPGPARRPVAGSNPGRPIATRAAARQCWRRDRGNSLAVAGRRQSLLSTRTDGADGTHARTSPRRASAGHRRWPWPASSATCPALPARPTRATPGSASPRRSNPGSGGG